MHPWAPFRARSASRAGAREWIAGLLTVFLCVWGIALIAASATFVRALWLLPSVGATVFSVLFIAAALIWLLGAWIVILNIVGPRDPEDFKAERLD